MSTIRLEKIYPVSKEIVWEYLTNNEHLSSWCMPAKNFILEKEKEFMFENTPSIFWDGKFFNKIMDFNVNKFLSYECYNQRSKLNSIVSWTLTEENGGTKLALEHSGFKVSHWLTKMILTGGWKKMMNTDLYNKLTVDN
ncbi:MAG: SRPBCC domain-containing protein [Prevotellaceae bacterium]|jgi:uncharacterized protein YndB with AHSA1/START domain|nr:SRPBCC domain-containing protein [Prevotellaceae bacterium]